MGGDDAVGGAVLVTRAAIGSAVRVRTEADRRYVGGDALARDAPARFGLRLRDRRLRLARRILRRAVRAEDADDLPRFDPVATLLNCFQLRRRELDGVLRDRRLTSQRGTGELRGRIVLDREKGVRRVRVRVLHAILEIGDGKTVGSI